eukprot:GHVN01027312.1.p1 GENE.GHVN01027312.1~~GHVN01027312.1.p1  ORF type:complete len:659 (-),score=134.26 GHVN01027312.1:63-2039(-)
MSSIFFDPTAFEDSLSYGVGGGYSEAGGGDEGDEGGDGGDEGEGGEGGAKGRSARKTKEAVLLVIELDESLFIEHDMTDHSMMSLGGDDQLTVKRTMWQELMLAFSDIMKNRIIASENDKFGVVLFGTGVTENTQKFDGIVTLLPLDYSDAHRIQSLERESERTRKEWRDRYGDVRGRTHSEAPLLANLFWLCSQMFHGDAQNKAFNPTVMLFTPIDNPVKQRDMAMQRLKDLQHDCASVKLFPLEPPGMKFDLLAFYADAIELNDSDFTEIQKLNFQDLRRRTRCKDIKQRPLGTLPFKLGEGLTFSVSVFTNVLEASPRLPIYLRAKDNEPLKSETKWICDQTTALLSPDEITTYIPYAKSKVFISKSDRQEICRCPEGIGLTLLGFKPRSVLKAHHNVKHSYFLYPAETPFKGSGVMAAALITCMARRDQVAIVRWVQRVTSPPSLAALIPQMELIDDDDEQIQPAGFHMVPLPFAEDIRHLQLSAPPKVEDSQVKMAQMAVLALELEDFHPSQVDNPVLQKHYGGLEALALGYDTMPDLPDGLTLAEEAVEARKDVILQWKKSVYGSTDVELPKSITSGTKRKSPSAPSAASRGAKSAKGGEKDESDALVSSAIKNGVMNKLTVVQLKEWLSNHKLPQSGKKADLSQRIEDALN